MLKLKDEQPVGRIAMINLMQNNILNSAKRLLIASAFIIAALALPLQSSALAKDGRPEDSSSHHSGGSHSAGSSDDSHSKSKSSGSSSTGGSSSSSKLEAKLLSPSNPRSATHGSLKLSRKAKNGALREESLDLRADIAPASIADSTSELRVEISRLGTPVTTCVAIFDEIEVKRRVQLAEYKVDLKRKGTGLLRAKDGYCDVDLSTSAVENGVPVLAAGDTITVINPMTNETLLAGVLGNKK